MSGRREIYVRPFPNPSGGTGLVWLVSFGGGASPRWSRDGTELFYLNAGAMMAAPVTSGPSSIELSAARLLFTGQYLDSFDVAVDGQRFLMIKDAAGASGR